MSGVARCVMERAHTDLVDLLCFEDVLQDFEIGDEFVLVFRVHLDSRHWHIPWNVFMVSSTMWICEAI